MKRLIVSLEAIADLADRASDLSKTQAAIQSAKILVQESKKKEGQAEQASLQQLETELDTWQSKLSVILNEPVGKKGMAKHARFWAEKLRTIHV